MKELVEKIVEYTRNWSISENEWYWNIDSVRKSNNVNEEHITEHEFEVAIREETLYDLVYNNGKNIEDQMNNDMQYGYTDEYFYKARRELEKEIKKVIPSFELYWKDYREKIDLEDSYLLLYKDTHSIGTYYIQWCDKRNIVLDSGDFTYETIEKYRNKKNWEKFIKDYMYVI